MGNTCEGNGYLPPCVCVTVHGGYDREAAELIAELLEVDFQRSANVFPSAGLPTCLCRWVATSGVLTWVSLLRLSLFEEWTPPTRLHGDSSMHGLCGNGAREKTALMLDFLWRSLGGFTTMASCGGYELCTLGKPRQDSPRGRSLGEPGIRDGSVWCMSTGGTTPVVV